MEDLSVAIDVVTAAPVASLSFNSAYNGLYKFSGPKKGHTAGYTVQVADGGNKAFVHAVTLKFFANNAADAKVIEDLVSGNVFVIVETNENQFKIYGGQNGMEVTAGQQNSGNASNADTTDQLTLNGDGEQYLPKIFFATDYATTLALLESYEV